jgi:hypothetical protein
MLIFKKGGLKMSEIGDFPGIMKRIMPAGNICEEGLRRNSELLIEKWHLELSLAGIVVESWIINGRQFFISNHYPPQLIFMGVLCAKNDDDSVKIAKKVVENCNCNLIVKFPCFYEIYTKTVITGNNRDVAFLSIIRKEIYLREKIPETEKKLVRAVEQFEKEKSNMPKSQ